MDSDRAEGRVVREELARVLSSGSFARSPRLSQFLRFIVECSLDHKQRELKESVIAVEVFGRKPDYDPKQDSIVRKEAVRLRSRLTEYYDREGNQDPLVIELPKGGYVPHFRQRTAPAKPLIASGGFWRSLAALVVIALVGAGWWIFHRTAPVTIAVLPLENLSPDSTNDYFVDGLTDEIIRDLSMIEGLAVRSRTSSFALKGIQRDVQTLGRQLRVDYIIEGSVLLDGKDLRINSQLVRVKDDFLLWSGRFERQLSDVFAIQEEISRGIANNLHLKLGPGRPRYETSVAAYDLYLRARALQMREGIRGHIRSIAILEEAVAQDPSFAPAYAGLASAYAIRSTQFPVYHPRDELEKMRAAADQAIRLDPLLAEAHEAQALAFARDGRWQEAEKSFLSAIERDGNRANTYANFAVWLLWVLGRNDEAIQQLHIAEEMDPLSSQVQALLGFVLISDGQFDEAFESCRKISGPDPLKNQCLARAQLFRGRIGDAIQLLEGNDEPPSPGFLGYAYARSGRHDEALKMAATSSYPNEKVLIFAGLGERDRALEALDRMAALGPQRVGMYLNYPELASLKEDPRLQALRNKVGLPK